jgi:putative ABC transport system ATP-binding protein
MIGGVDKPTSGSVVVGGVDISVLDESRLREYRLQRVGYIFQLFNPVPTLNALENVMLPMILAGRKRSEAKKRALELLELVGLHGKEQRMPEELSGGERQRMAIAIALANDPPLILADEPTGELDIANAEKVMALMKKLVEEKGKTFC